MAENGRVDIIIFGASGFTGKHAVLELAKLVKEKGNITWAVAGRFKAKLEAVLKEAGEKAGVDLTKIPILAAEVSDYDALCSLAVRCNVLVNCVGPYRFYGEPVVQACVNNGTHYVDVSGEPHFIEKMQLEYHDKACETGAYIISACGLDSIPADLGAIFLKKNFKGELNSVETYMETWNDKKVKGAVINYGTWDSLVNGISSRAELKPLREKLFPKRLPQMLPKLKPKPFIHKSSVVNGWCLPFLGADKSVMYRTQRFLYEHDKQRPAQVQAYVAFRSLFTVLALCVFGLILIVTSLTKCGKKLLLQYPRFFTAGYVSREGPSEETMEDSKFSVTLYGEGWKEKLAEPTDQHTDPPNKSMVVKVSGTNPGYGATCVALVLSAYTLLNETDKMPDKGGVLPPGAAFANTSLIEELDKHGVKFEVVSTEEK